MKTGKTALLRTLEITPVDKRSTPGVYVKQTCNANNLLSYLNQETLLTMNSFDSSIIHFINGFSQKSLFFNVLMLLLGYINLFKGGVLVGIVWWLWFRDENENYLVREHLISALVGCLVALFIARILILTLPIRIRPSSNPNVKFLIPYGMKTIGLAGGSTFPSDHAVLFSTLAFSYWFISKKWGVFAISYVLIVICFPRIYLGLHYPTDILAGTVLGFAIAFIFNSPKIRHNVSKPFFFLMNRQPGLFYLIFFLISYQLVVLFYDFREIGIRLFKYLLIFSGSLQRILFTNT